MVGQVGTLRSLRKAQSPFVVGSLGEVAAVTALRFPERVRERFELNRRGVEYLEGELAARGIRFVPTQANFIWLRLGPGTPPSGRCPAGAWHPDPPGNRRVDPRVDRHRVREPSLHRRPGPSTKATQLLTSGTRIIASRLPQWVLALSLTRV